MAVASAVQPSLVRRARLDDPPLVRWGVGKLSIPRPVATPGVAVIARLCRTVGFRRGSFEDHEEERPEGGDAGCDDKDKDFVAGVGAMSV